MFVSIRIGLEETGPQEIQVIDAAGQVHVASASAGVGTLHIDDGQTIIIGVDPRVADASTIAGENDQIAALTADKATLASQVQTLGAENTSLSEQVQTVTADKDALTGQVAALNAQVADLQAQLAAAQAASAPAPSPAPAPAP